MIMCSVASNVSFLLSSLHYLNESVVSVKQWR